MIRIKENRSGTAIPAVFYADLANALAFEFFYDIAKQIIKSNFAMS